MSAQLVWQAVVDTLTLGATYSLVAVGFVVIFRATGLFNFAHGHFMALAGYLAVTIERSTGLGYVGVAVIVVGLMFAVGALTYAVLLRPLLGYPLWAAVMVTLGVSIVIEGIISIVWYQNSFDLSWVAPLDRVDVGLGAVTSNIALFNVAVAAVVFIVLDRWLSKTRAGVRMRAAAENPLLAGLSGVRVVGYFALAWGIAGATAALAGLGYSTQALVSPSLIGLGLRAFPAALIGGMDSVRGAAAGGLLVALAETIGVRVFGSAAADAIVFLILILTLTLRPYGLFGSREVARV